MNRSAGGLVLLLVGSIGLIGFLTSNLDRWLNYLFTSPSAPAATGTGTTSPTSTSGGSATTQRGAA